MNVRSPLPEDMAVGMAGEHREIRATAARFATEVLAPLSRHIEAEGAIPLDVRRQMGGLGLIGLELPEEYGGLGMDHFTSGVVIEGAVMQAA